MMLQQVRLAFLVVGGFVGYAVFLARNPIPA